MEENDNIMDVSDIAHMKSDVMTRRRKGEVVLSITSLFLGFVLILFLAASGVGVYFYLDYMNQWISTHNAFVEGNIYTIASIQPGRIESLPAAENKQVDQGDVLAQIDSTMQALAVKKVEASIDLNNLTISTLTGLPGRAAELEMARARQNELNILLEETELIYQQTTVLSPSAGYVSHIQAREGESVLPGQPLMSVVNLDDLWVVANFNEEQIRDLRPGQEVDIHIDAFPDEVLRGKVDSIMPASGAAFALFPPDATSGNWVRVPQRISVKIVFAENRVDEDVDLRIGMLARVRVEQ